jgi:hypothetical protein
LIAVYTDALGPERKKNINPSNKHEWTGVEAENRDSEVLKPKT